MGDLTRNFSRWEFRCPCGCGRDGISHELVSRLQEVRTVYGQPMTITSGVRCHEHNRQVGGAPRSAHLLGLAADVRCEDDEARFRLVDLGLAAGFRRVGIYHDRPAVHFDAAEQLPSPRLWAK